MFLTDVIVELGFADHETVEAAVEWTRENGGTPESCLLRNGTIDERQLSLAVAERNGLDHVDLDHFQVDGEALAMIGRSTAARYSAVPIAFAVDGALLVAIEDPGNMLGISDIEVTTRSEVRLVVAARSQIQRLIDKVPAEPPRAAPEPPPLAQTPAAAEREPPAVTPGPAAAQPEPPIAAPEPPPAQPEPPPSEPEPVPAQPEPPIAGPTRTDPESVGPPPPAGEPIDGDLGEISATLQEKMRDVGMLVNAVEQGWRRSSERERRLEERLAVLEESLAKTATARELASEASEKLGELRGLLGEDG
ncbi:MAG: hypothetical protein ACM3NV_04515 [Syntrophothermus sp.]